MKHNFHNLEIWKLGLKLADAIYDVTESFPKNERFGMVDQLKRASISVPSNIAEGCGRGTVPQLKYFLNVTVGSLAELETQIHISKGRRFINQDDAKKLIEQISKIRRMTLSFQKTLK